jgi:hypothetical protein
MPTKYGAALMATERYHPLFASDLASACSSYDSIAETLGNRFRRNVRSIIQTVVERPESFGRIGGDFRGALVHRFPYVVVFTNDGGIPTIVGLRHAASDRRDWFSRAMPLASGEPDDAREPPS